MSSPASSSSFTPPFSAGAAPAVAASAPLISYDLRDANNGYVSLIRNAVELLPSACILHLQQAVFTANANTLHGRDYPLLDVYPPDSSDVQLRDHDAARDPEDRISSLLPAPATGERHIKQPRIIIVARPLQKSLLLPASTAGSLPSTPQRAASSAAADGVLPELSPLKADSKGDPSAALTVLKDTATIYPLSHAYWDNLESAVQLSIRGGSDEQAVWAFVQRVHAEWSARFRTKARTLLSWASRRKRAAELFEAVEGSGDHQVCRLLTGVRGVGKSTLLRVLSVAVQIAFGDAMLVIYHDFVHNGRGGRRHHVTALLSAAIRTRWDLTENDLQRRLEHPNCQDGDMLQQLFTACYMLGKEKCADFTSVVLFADELQDLFDNQEPSQRLLAQLKKCALSPRVPTFLTGSAYHLIDGLRGQNFHLPGKMVPQRMLPILQRDELQATQELWHRSWSDPAEFAGLGGQQLKDALVTRLYLHTGGVLRDMLYCSSSDVMQQSAVEPRIQSHLPILAVLAVLYARNHEKLRVKGDAAAAHARTTGADEVAARAAAETFDPFDQALVSMDEMRVAAWEQPVNESLIHEVADAGWLLLDGDDTPMSRGTFLRPAHYALMERSIHGLSLLERAAVLFPEGRTLGEQWEVFYAEHLVEEEGLRWYGRERHLEHFSHRQPHPGAYFTQHSHTVFKPFPDTIGYDLMWWTVSPFGEEAVQPNQAKKPRHEESDHTRVLVVHFAQIQVGRSCNVVALSSLSQAQQFALNHVGEFKRVQFEQPVNGTAPEATGRFDVQIQFQLVTSRKVSNPTGKALEEAKIRVMTAKEPSHWGRRVSAFCASTPFAIFQ